MENSPKRCYSHYNENGGVFVQNQYVENAASLGKILQARRKDLGITQKQLADYCDLSHNGISRIEIGETDVRMSAIFKMSSMLGFRIVLEMNE